MLDSLIGAGFRRIFLLNSHGGNITPGRMAIYDVHLNHRDIKDLYLAFSSWWTIAAAQVAGLANVEQEFVSHACELETSMILRLRPELVSSKRPAARPSPSIGVLLSGLPPPQRVDVPRGFDQ